MRKILAQFLAKLQQRQDGVAAVEFALITPLLVMLFFGAVEMSNLLIADSRLRNVAGSLSDLITQKTDGTITASDLNTANVAAQQIMLPLPISGTKLAVLFTTYRPTSISAANVIWTRLIVVGTTGNQRGTTVLGLTTPACSDTSLPANLLPPTASSPFNDVLKVTAVYRWQPWFASIFSTSIDLRSTNYNMPRYTLTLGVDSSINPAC